MCLYLLLIISRLAEYEWCDLSDLFSKCMLNALTRPIDAFPRFTYPLDMNLVLGRQWKRATITHTLALLTTDLDCAQYIPFRLEAVPRAIQSRIDVLVSE